MSAVETLLENNKSDDSEVIALLKEALDDNMRARECADFVDTQILLLIFGVDNSISKKDLKNAFFMIRNLLDDYWRLADSRLEEIADNLKGVGCSYYTKGV